MNCFICGKSFSEIEFNKEIIPYCASCDYTQEKHNQNQQNPINQNFGKNQIIQNLQELILLIKEFKIWY